MNEFNANTRASRFAKYRTAVVALVVVALGGVGFAAGGGAEIVKRLFVTVELVGEDGSVFVGSLEELKDGGQFAVLEAMHVEGEEGAMVLIELAEGAEVGDVGPEAVFSLKLGGESESSVLKMNELLIGGKGMRIVTAPLLEVHRGSETIVDTIGEAEEAIEWVGDDDSWHELSVVRVGEDDPAGPGFRVYLSVESKDGSDAFALVDSLSGDQWADFDVDAIEVTEDGIGLVTFVDGDGERVERSVASAERTMADFELHSVVIDVQPDVKGDVRELGRGDR